MSEGRFPRRPIREINPTNRETKSTIRQLNRPTTERPHRSDRGGCGGRPGSLVAFRQPSPAGSRSPLSARGFPTPRSCRSRSEVAFLIRQGRAMAPRCRIRGIAQPSTRPPLKAGRGSGPPSTCPHSSDAATRHISGQQSVKTRVRGYANPQCVGVAQSAW